MSARYFANCYSTSSAQLSDVCEIHMQVTPEFSSTSQYPHIASFLATHLASIFENKCYNDDNLPFAEEVKNTEMGHFFEHVLLEHLCMEKINAGYPRAHYDGRTYWDTQKHDGTFLVRVTCPESEHDLLEKALHKTHQLMNQLIGINNQPKRTAVIAVR